MDKVYYDNDDQGITASGHIGGIIGKLEPPDLLQHVGNVLITRVHSAGVMTKKTTRDGAIGGLLGRVMKLKNLTINNLRLI